MVVEAVMVIGAVQNAAEKTANALNALQVAVERNARLTTIQNWIMIALTIAIAAMTLALLF